MLAKGSPHAAGDTLSTDRDGKRKACDVCKRRKVRCTGENPCQNCSRNGVPCQYTMSHGRLAHLERRLLRLQERMRTFEEAWRRFVPGIELSVAIHAVENQISVPPMDNLFGTKTSLAVDPTSAATAVVSNSMSLTSSQPVDLEHTEKEHEDAETLDWDESIDVMSAADGIGSLSMNSKGIGYMGPQSGNAVLKNLKSIMVLYNWPYDDSAILQPPKPAISDKVLQSSPFCSQCVDWYFRYYHCAYPILHEGYFRAQFMGAIPKPKDGSWPILFNTVLAIGASSSELCNQNADIYYYREAVKGLSWAIFQRGTLSIVQALALLANYVQKRNRPNSGFTLLGVAMNMAQGIGLHRELSGPTISAFTMEIRRRVWWTLFIFDSGARVTFGRPIPNLGGINTQLPRNLGDEDLAVDIDELPNSQDVPTVTSSLIWQTKLAKIGNMANEELLKANPPNQLNVIGICDKIANWTQSLPDYMRAEFSNAEYRKFDVPRMVLLWRSMHLRIVITRPFILDSIRARSGLDLSSAATPASRCLLAAEECVSSILTFWNCTDSHHGSLAWYTCYWLVTAVFVHATCLLYDPQNHLAGAWRQQVLDSKAALESMGAFELTAIRAAQVLDNIMGLVPSSPDSTFFAMNEPIRMEFAEVWNQSWTDMIVPQETSPPGADRQIGLPWTSI